MTLRNLCHNDLIFDILDNSCAKLSEVFKRPLNILSTKKNKILIFYCNQTDLDLDLDIELRCISGCVQGLLSLLRESHDLNSRDFLVLFLWLSVQRSLSSNLLDCSL